MKKHPPQKIEVIIIGNVIITVIMLLFDELDCDIRIGISPGSRNGGRPGEPLGPLHLSQASILLLLCTPI